eukprot:6208722-Lingulodinium_polyedra.AAC.1
MNSVLTEATSIVMDSMCKCLHRGNICSHGLNVQVSSQRQQLESWRLEWNLVDCQVNFSACCCNVVQ